MPVQNKLSVKQIEHTKCPADKESLRLKDGDTVVFNVVRGAITLKLLIVYKAYVRFREVVSLLY